MFKLFQITCAMFTIFIITGCQDISRETYTETSDVNLTAIR